jgi:RNA polymerase sigma-70 factor (ECF subfamily)
MDEQALAEQFELNRTQLRAVAYRMLGSQPEAEDAVQEAWLRLRRVDADELDNLAAWLTTVVARVCLDVLRSRTSRREDPLDSRPAAAAPADTDPERTAVLADSVGVAMLVVLETLTPNERLAFVLHDMFDVEYDEIAAIVDQSPAGARQLVSRARRRVRERPGPAHAEPGRQQQVVTAFLAAAREGRFDDLISLLHPDVVLRGDAAAARLRGAAPETRGADAVASFFNGRAQGAIPALLGGRAGAIVQVGGKVRLALRFTVVDGQITDIESIADPDSLRALVPETLV